MHAGTKVRTKEQALSALDRAATTFNGQFYRAMVRTPDMAYITDEARETIIKRWQDAVLSYTREYQDALYEFDRDSSSFKDSTFDTFRAATKAKLGAFAQKHYGGINEGNTLRVLNKAMDSRLFNGQEMKMINSEIARIKAQQLGEIVNTRLLKLKRRGELD